MHPCSTLRKSNNLALLAHVAENSKKLLRNCSWEYPKYREFVRQKFFMATLNSRCYITEKCLLKISDCFFWSSISRDKKMTANCLQFSKQQPKEPLQPHHRPECYCLLRHVLTAPDFRTRGIIICMFRTSRL